MPQEALSASVRPDAPKTKTCLGLFLALLIAMGPPAEVNAQSASGKIKDGSGKARGSDKNEPNDRAEGASQDKGRAAAGQRMSRLLRWTLIFDTKDGEDYARQLQALGAFLAAPEGGGRFRVFRDLAKRPATGRIEDLREVNHISWVDDKKESVQSLSKALGLEPVPQHIVAFFPVKLEREL